MRCEWRRLLVGLLLELVENSQGLGDLVVQRVVVLKKMKELGVVHLQQHAGDLASKFGLGAVDEVFQYPWVYRKKKKLTRRSSCTSPHRASAFAPWATRWRAQRRRWVEPRWRVRRQLRCVAAGWT